jgi:hypothetical protein
MIEDENLNSAVSPGFQKENGSANTRTPNLSSAAVAVREVGGRDGLDPTRYGDWEKNGRCIDF